MELPNDSIGISDILDYRECAQRFAFKMRRHVELPERFQLYPGEKDEPPEATDWTNAYGSCIHEAISIVEREFVSDVDALSRAWREYQHWLEPEDRDRLLADLETYHTRSQLGYKLVAAERDMRVPLFVHNGRQIYFRFKIDALYQRIDNPSVFLMRDYKSSRHRKSEYEIHRDLQQWSYNFGVHELFPEIETLIQIYDQLRFGETPTRKNAQQRRQIKDWLIEQVKAILEDVTLKPTMNDWCQYCPILMDCRVTHRASQYWIKRLAALAPERKVGRKIVVELSDDPADYSEYVDVLPEAEKATKLIKRFIDTVKADIKQMPTEQRDDLGYEVREGQQDRFTAEALRRVLEIVGPEEFVHLVSLSKSSLEGFYGKDDATYQQLVALAEKGIGKTEVRPKKPRAA